MAQPKSPNARIIQQFALENREVLEMLATNGRYKPQRGKSSAE